MDISDIARILNARQYGNHYRARCPVHEDKHPSLWFSDRGGKLHFQCKAGCDYRNIRAALGLHRGIKVDSLPLPVERDFLEESIKLNKIKRSWDKAKVITETSPVWIYLTKTRRVLKESQPIPVVLREAQLKYYDYEQKYIGTFPSMLARLDKPDGTIATLHRTYLNPDGTKINLTPAKKLMTSPYAGCTDGGAIRLFDPVDGVLGIAEGIETALACFTLFDIPTWAAWSSTGLAKFVVPDNVTDLFIFADNDTAGLKYAGDLIRRLNSLDKNGKSLRLNIRLHAPAKKGDDFADVLFRGELS